MMVKKVFALTKKIDKYYNNMRNANIKMPNRLFGMKVRAMLSCAFYGCSFYEYFSYRFWEKTYNQKKDYLLHRNLSSFFDRFNDKNFRDRMGDKSQANAYYGECLKRDFYDLENGEDGFIAFCLKHKNIFLKRKVGWGGEGSVRAIIENDADAKELLKKIDSAYIVEPIIENCDEIKEFAPSTLNKIRIITIVNNNQARVYKAYIRFGKNSDVDNIHLGGIGALIDVENGVIESLACDGSFDTYSYHPISNKKIIGFKIPYWQEVIELVEKAALVTPQLRYVGWDIAITQNGPIIIEGNWDGEFHFLQQMYDKGLKSELYNLLEN